LITFSERPEENMLQVGDPVPDFDLASDKAGDVKASELRGKRYVLYFYPRDDTPGCTAEACNFRDNLPHFGSLKVPVYGISTDDVASHAKFRAKFGLTFPLLADTKHATAEAFGTWVEKNNYGKKYMGIQRSTFVIGPDGRIERVWEKVNPANHAAEVLAYLKTAPVATASAPVETQPPAAPADPAEPAPEAAAETPTPIAASKTARKAALTGGAKKAAAPKAAKTAKKGAAKKSAAKKTAAKKTARKATQK
jgi:thioredoxin-dependent peroxiredoxin